MLRFDVLSCTMMQHAVATCRKALQLVVSLLCSWALARRSHCLAGLAGLALLLALPAHVAAQTAITDTNLNTAVIAWVSNPTEATTWYGPIADWNTAAVTSMANLLYPSNTARPTFNSDISKWNVASVSNMYRVRLASVCAAYSLSHVLSLSSSTDLRNVFIHRCILIYIYIIYIYINIIYVFI
jgi:hypothetical protein